MPSVESRKHTRTPVSVPVNFSSLDERGEPLNYGMGVIRDVSQSGVALEIYGDPQSVRILISFVDVAGKITEIKGKTVYTRRINPRKIRMGVLLLGNPTENIGFVKELVRFHHYTKKSKSG